MIEPDAGPEADGSRWETVCRVDEVPADRPVGRLVGTSGHDRDRVCVALAAPSEPVAMLDRCPHRDIALSGGVVRDGVLVCPGHFWRFALPAGIRTDGDESATTYPTRVVDGWVQALVPPAPPRVSMREWLLLQARQAREAEDG